MSTTTPYLGLTLYDSSTDQSVLFATFRAVWGGTATTSNFYKIDTSASGFNTRITALETTPPPIVVPALFSSSNFYVASGISSITAYNSGMTIILSLDTTSSGTVTLNINSLGTKSVMKVDSTGTPINLTGSDLVIGRRYLFMYDGTRWLWVSANSADQIQIVGTTGNIVVVGSSNNLDGSNTPQTVVSGAIHNASAKTTAEEADEVGIWGSTALTLKKLTWTSVRNSAIGTGSYFNDSSFTSDLVAWGKIFPIINNSTNAGKIFNSTVVATYALVSAPAFAYIGGVLAPNGDIHYIPNTATVGQKVSSTGVVSTYSLVYTVSSAYAGGVLTPNGDIHFAPQSATVGQKINASGVVSTYSLVYTVASAYNGGIISPSGEVHFIAASAAVGQKISTSGTVSTYSLVYTTTNAYNGGALAPNGEIHFVPQSATVGQKISTSGTVSTYSLVYTTTLAYAGGVLAPNGDIHFIPRSATVGQKISTSGIVSTYSLVYTTTNAYLGGVLSSSGEIHFVPLSGTVGQKISSAGVVSTYSLVYTTSNAYGGGVLNTLDEIHFIPFSAANGQKIVNMSMLPFRSGIAMSPFYNKL